MLSFGGDADDDDDNDAAAFADGVRFRSAHETLREGGRLEQAEAGVHDEHVAELQARLAQENVRVVHVCDMCHSCVLARQFIWGGRRQ